MRAPALLTTILLLGSCATAPKAAEEKSAPPVAETLRIGEMEAFEARVARAAAQGELARLRETLDAAAEGRQPWDVVKAAYAQMPEDADGAWNRLREVTVMTAQPGPSYWARLGMADVYIGWGVLDQAKGQIDKALAIAPQSEPALLRVGRLAVKGGKPDAAAAAWQQALDVGGGPAGAPAAAVALAALDHTGKADDKARTLVDAVLAAHPDRVDALLLAAELTSDDAKGAASAVSLLERAVKAAPGDPDLKVRLAKARAEAGDTAGALAARQALTVERPKDLEAWRTQVELARGLGDAGAERAALEQVARLSPDDVEALRRLAELQLAAGETTDAEASLTELLVRKPADGPALLARGRIREGEHNLLGAVGDYRGAVAAGVDGAKEALEALDGRLGMPAKKVAGRTPDAVYQAVLRILGKAYVARLEELPRLGGTYAVKVWVEEGAVAEAEVAENTLHDPVIEALAWWLVRDASFPKAKGRKEFTLPFAFNPPD